MMMTRKGIRFILLKRLRVHSARSVPSSFHSSPDDDCGKPVDRSGMGKCQGFKVKIGVVGAIGLEPTDLTEWSFKRESILKRPSVLYFL